MPVISCPHCGTKLNAPDAVLGQEVVCGRCKRAFAAQADQPGLGAPPYGGGPVPGEPGAPAAGPDVTVTGPSAGPDEPTAPYGPAAPSAPSPGPAAPKPLFGAPTPPAAPSAGPAAPKPPLGAPTPPAAPSAGPRPIPPPPPQAGYVPPIGFPQPLKTSGYAVASLILGICSLVFCWCYGVPSLICGILALVFHASASRDIAAGLVSPNSAGMAKAGRICGLIGLVLGVGFWVILLVAFLAGGLH